MEGFIDRAGFIHENKVISAVPGKRRLRCVDQQ